MVIHCDVQVFQKGNLLGLVQRLNFSCAESNANKQNPLFICSFALMDLAHEKFDVCTALRNVLWQNFSNTTNKNGEILKCLSCEKYLIFYHARRGSNVAF